ncbi:MAG TPA: aldolase/citrate lyase family protein, partial [Acidobacteriota bacterium]|nr:aldolase/citrate lyase family protein [Acidobacteriota bacterium]
MNSMNTPVRRSMLYVPGDSEKMLQKAALLPADVILLNLEDGVAAAKKTAARENVARALNSVDYGRREKLVRINPFDTETGILDLSAIIPSRPDGICFPKVETAGAVISAAAGISRLEAECGIKEGSVRIHAMIESAVGVVHAY